MHPYDRIVLAIPHATGAFDASLWSDPDAVARDARRWTDWLTDRLFGDAGRGDPRVRAVVGRVNRFDCDLERLEDDPLEGIGQGRLYTRSHSGAERAVPPDRAARWIRAWHRYRERILAAGADAERPFLLDGHSFPADLAPDVDVCLGWNEDASRPADDILASARDVFEAHGLRVAFNEPYGNAILPDGWRGPSMLIEINKAIYLDERTLGPLPGARRVVEALRRLYDVLAGGVAVRGRAVRGESPESGGPGRT